MSLSGLSSSLNSDLSLQQAKAVESGMARCMGHNADSLCVRINDLPDELLIKVFSYISLTELIDVIQKVCYRWKRLSQDAELWMDKEYNIRKWDHLDWEKGTNPCQNDWDEEKITQTLCNAPNLRKIRIRLPVSSQVLCTLYTRCHQLTELRLLCSQNLTYSELKNIAENCSKIHTLGISISLLQSEKFVEAVSQFEQLRVLEVRGYFKYTLEYFCDSLPLRPLANGWPQLCEVDFRSTTLDIDDLRYFLNAKRKTLKSIHIMWAMDKRCVIPSLSVCADSLECLELYNDFDSCDSEEREKIIALRSFTNLQKLKMQMPIPPYIDYMVFKSGGLPKLKVLELSGAEYLKNDTIIAICHGCPALRELHVKHARLLSDDAFSQIHHLNNLTILNVSGCKGLGGAFIPYLTTLPQLHTLLMEQLELPKLEPGLASILDLSNLLCLKLNSSITTGMPFDKFPGKLGSLRAGVLPKLKVLELSGVEYLKNDTIIAICHGCPALRELHVKHATLLSGDAFSQIHHLNTLTTLNVSGCKGLGGAFIPYLTTLPQLHTLLMEQLELPKLEPGLGNILNLSNLHCLILNFSKITGMPFDKFPGKLGSLRELQIHNCQGDSIARDVLTEQMPNLRIHGFTVEEELNGMGDHYSDEDEAEEIDDPPLSG